MFSGIRAARKFAKTAGATFSRQSAGCGVPSTCKSFESGVEGGKSTVAFYAQSTENVARAFGVFKDFGVECTSVTSKPDTFTGANRFVVDFVGKPTDARVQQCCDRLAQDVGEVKFEKPLQVPYFPSHISHIDNFSQKCLMGGAELEADHPGFADRTYRERRDQVVYAAESFRFGDALPRVSYTEAELATWTEVYEKLRGFTRKFAVREFNEVLDVLEENVGFTATNIPQLADISDFLFSRTGFTLRPVGGLLSARDFLNGLAFKVFFSTQYIRHHSKPLYTPEPDIIHELLGHAPMFANPEFAKFSHEIGLASLGASDDFIQKLATLYWFSVEFGLCHQDGAMKAYGAGLLSSFGELEYACSPTRPAGGEDKFPEYRPWEPEAACTESYPITCYQPLYYVADSLEDACVRMRKFCESSPRPFSVTFDEKTQSVSVDRALERGEYKVTMQK